MGGVAAGAAVVAALVYYDHMPTAIAVSLPHYLSLHVSTCLYFLFRLPC